VGHIAKGLERNGTAHGFDRKSAKHLSRFAPLDAPEGKQTMRFFFPWTVGLLPAALLLVACTPIAGDESADPWAAGEPALVHPKSKAAAVYAESTVVDFDVGFAADVQQEFLAAWKPIKDTSTWFHCSFGFARERFLDAACRHKSGSANPQSEKKPPLIVRFDKWDDSGRFFGLREINLEATPEFAAPIRDRVGMWVMRHSGILAPRVNHAKVTLNGQALGLYQNIEVIDHEFLEQRFEPPIGDLYKPDNQNWNLLTNSSTGNTKPVSDLTTLIAQWKASPTTAYEDQLRSTVDTSEVLRASAAEMVLPVCDNFSNGGQNFYVYQLMDSRLVIFPWDLDQTISDRAPADSDLWLFLGNLANSNVFPTIGLDLRKMLFGNAAWKTEYDDDVVAIRDGAYAAAKDRTAKVCDEIRSYVAEDPNAYGTIDEFDADCASVADRIDQRIEYLRGALGR
jgi:hypothetical protein